MPRPLIGLNCDHAHRAPYGRVEKRLVLNLTYVQAVTDAGGIPVVLPWQNPKAIPGLLKGLDGLLLTGGDDPDPKLYGRKLHPAEVLMDPERQAFDLALIRAVLKRRMPVLAICLGSQMLNLVRGGTLVQDIPSQVRGAGAHKPVKGVPPWHAVRIQRGSRLAGILGTSSLAANSFHHQAVGEVGRGLKAVAHAPDGVVEGIEDPGHPFLVGVQWHPERCYRERPHQARLFRALVLAAGRRKS